MGIDKIPTELTAVADRLVRERRDVIAKARKILNMPPPQPANRYDSGPVQTWAETQIDVQLVTLGVHWRSGADAEIEHIEYGRRVSMETAGKADQKRFLESVLKFKWLSPQLRRAIMTELGLSLRKQKKEINEALAVTRRVLIEERKALMRKRGERPRGGIHQAAIEQVAATQGMTVDALKKQLERYRQTPEERRHLREMVIRR